MPIIDNELIGEGTSCEFQIPNVPLGIFIETSIRKNVEAHGNSKWLTDVSTGKSMNYHQLFQGMRSVASGLRKRGFQTGDKLVVIGSNFIEIPLMSLAVWRAGGSQACLSVNLSHDAIDHRMREIGNKFVLTDYARAGRIVDVVKGLDFVREVFVIGDNPVTGCTQFNELLQDPGDECPENLDDVDMSSMAWLAYTSGTTGLAKCVVMPHKTVVGSLSRFKPSDNQVGTKFLFVNPMNNTYGLSLLLGMTLGCRDIYCLSDFSEDNLLSAIQQFKPVAISLFPAHIAWLCKHPHLNKFDLSSVKTVSIAGSSINPAYERQIFDKLPNLLFLNNAYGMTEVGLTCQHPSPTDWAQLDKSQAIARHIFRSVGIVGPFCKLKVIDCDTGEKLGPNQVGEICLQSPFMLKEYLNRPKETAEFIRGGWAHTGDKGYYDEKEHVYVIGRYKELIKYRNIHVVPTNVEKYLMAHPAVEDAAVVGLPHDIDGEWPLAFVVLSPETHVTAEELIAYMNEKVMDEEKLRGGIRFTNKIPRNDLGKIIRPELMKLLQL
ncbi:4-coumarate--CoA ligase 1-like [Daphnia pulicaria]|uniref:4-coumarate--CoA ligase 1-like n=1 Tax=Daphnia pulicaria TaxID=35523 RepID=UPI001EEBD031|nr:4-coumarate--CoA ligase 1-like [Daphnia pulicaria]